MALKTWQREGVAGGTALILALLPGLQHSDQEVSSIQPCRLHLKEDMSGRLPVAACTAPCDEGKDM